MINQTKCRVLQTRRKIANAHIIVHRQELKEFWNELSLLEKQRLLCIRDPTIITYTWYQLQLYLTNKKYKDLYTAYTVRRVFSPADIRNPASIIANSYDCFVLRQQAHDKQMREVVSAFLLIDKPYKDPIYSHEKIHEVADNSILGSGWLLKVKASYIDRVPSFLEHFVKDYFDGEKILLSAEQYGQFINEWYMNRPHLTHSEGINKYVLDLFVCILVLIQNQILLTFTQKKGYQILHRRVYEEPIKIVEKPKSKSYVTSTNNLGEVDWNSLKMDLAQIKYRIEEREDSYVYYRHNFNDENEVDTDGEDSEYTDVEDQQITAAFRMRNMPMHYY